MAIEMVRRAATMAATRAFGCEFLPENRLYESGGHKMMRSGTLAMFDALGFKGIWNRYDVKRDPECVMRKLIASERYALELMSKDFGSVESAVANPGNQLAALDVACFSDTIVLGVSSKSAEQLARVGVPSSFQWNMLVACRFANAIQRAAALQPPAFAYRGCIT